MIYPWQQHQWQQLMQALSQQRLHHALLCYGQAGTGKLDLSRALAHALLCNAPQDDGQACGHCASCRLLAAGTHPDLIWLRPQPPKNSTSKNPVLSIRVEAVRDLGDRLATTAQLDGRRVAIIEDADSMNQHAANSLLKTLEEPGDDTHLVLVSSRPHRLPVTIRSRCQQLVFPVPPPATATRWLQQQGIASAEQALACHHGAPLAAMRPDTDDAHREVLASALLARRKQQASLQYSDALAKLPRSAMLARFMDWLTDVVLVKSGLDSRVVNQAHRRELAAIAPAADWARLYRLQDEVNRLARHDAIALNNRLLWENLLISWDRL